MEKTKVTTRVWNKLFPLRIGDYILVKGDILSFKGPKIATLEIVEIYFHEHNLAGIHYVRTSKLIGGIGVFSGSQSFDLGKDILGVIRWEDYGTI